MDINQYIVIFLRPFVDIQEAQARWLVADVICAPQMKVVDCVGMNNSNLDFFDDRFRAHLMMAGNGSTSVPVGSTLVPLVVLPMIQTNYVIIRNNFVVVLRIVTAMRFRFC